MPLIKLPSPEESEKFKTKLTSMLNDAIKIELSTIPLYIFAIISLRTVPMEGEANAEARAAADEGIKAAMAARARIAVVVHQEMLHLALAGNLLTAVDSAPQLYSPDKLVNYGEDTILHSAIPLNLEKCKREMLKRFLQIEAPYMPPVVLSPDLEVANVPELQAGDEIVPAIGIADEYHSIGEFYAALGEEIKKIDLNFSAGDFKNPDLQFTQNDFFGSNMIQITNQASALEALKIIVDQGEGSVGVEEAHYQMFLSLYQSLEDWNCWELRPNPKEDDYKSDAFLYQLARASNAIFCYLLVTLQKTWEVSDPVLRKELTRNIHAIMISLMTPVYGFMVRQPIPGSRTSEHASPPFQYYKLSKQPRSTDEAGKALYIAVVDHLKQAVNATKDVGKKKELNLILFSVDNVKWPL